MDAGGAYALTAATVINDGQRCLTPVGSYSASAGRGGTGPSPAPATVLSGSAPQRRRVGQAPSRHAAGLAGHGAAGSSPGMVGNGPIVRASFKPISSATTMAMWKRPNIASIQVSDATPSITGVMSPKPAPVSVHRLK